ncbi:MAG TPA: sigma factor [Polyangiaceae bacterium]|jgi:hypothetical protein
MDAPGGDREGRALLEVLLRFARRVARSDGHAEDLAQEAYVRLRTTRAFRPGDGRTLEGHLLGIVRSLRSNAVTSRRPDYERQAGSEQLLVAGSTASTEAAWVEQEERADDEAAAARRTEALREKLRAGGCALELSVCDLMADGVTKRAEIAARLGRSDAETAAALRRIRRYMNSVMAAESGRDEEVA